MQKYVFPFNKLKLHIDKLSKPITKIKMCNHFFYIHISYLQYKQYIWVLFFILLPKNLILRFILNRKYIPLTHNILTH